MIIRDKYNALLNKDLTLNDVLQINEFKKMCKRENNHEYFYLSTILIIDIYIEENMYEEALQLALKDINLVDSNVFKNIYLYLLERIIYIYIARKNYKSAYRYVYRKRNVIDLENKEEVNRWYLEMSYVYAELNEQSRALRNLQAILENYPNDEIKNVALSNMTKIYIDQGMIKEAKDSLNQCLELVIELNDHEGKIYCDYLLAKIYILEKNYKFAKKIYDEIFKNKDELPIDYLNLVNEYILLLINMNLYKNAIDVVNEYENLFEDANIYIKKEFYKNKVKLAIFKNSNMTDELDKVLKMIDILDDEITHSKELVLNEAAEDEKTEEVQQSLISTVSKLEKTIHLLTFALNHDNERASLMDFSKRLEELVVFDEALYVILDRPDNDFIPNFLDSFTQFTSYQYKKDRLYERNHSYQSLINTPIEYIMQNSKEIIIDFSESNIPIKDLITTKNYNDLAVRSLIAIPLFHGSELFGAAIFISHYDLTTNENVLILKIAGKLLEFKLSSLFYQENLRSQRNILQLAINQLQEGLFYFEPNKDKIFLTERLQSFLNVNKRIISREEYINVIHENDRKNYLQLLNSKVNNGDEYDLEYRLYNKNNTIMVREVANPYITVDGFIKFYIGTINKIPHIELQKEDLFLSHHDFLIKLKELKDQTINPEYKFSLVRIKIKNLNEINLPINKLINKMIEPISLNFELTNQDIYCLNDYSLIFILNNCIDQRVIDKYIKNNNKELHQLELDNRIYSIDAIYSVSRYPRDSVNISKIFNITDMILNLGNGIYFDEQTDQKYTMKAVINNCVEEYLKEDAKLLYTPITSANSLIGYEIINNINGIALNQNFRCFLTNENTINLDQLNFKELVNNLKEKPFKTFIKVSSDSMELMISEKTIKYHPFNQYITLIFDRACEERQLHSLFDKLLSLDYKVGLTYSIMNNYSLNFIRNYGRLIYFEESNMNEFKNVTSILEALGTTVIINKIDTNYAKAYFRLSEYLELNQTNRRGL